MKVSVIFFRFLQARLITVVLVFFKIETEQDYFIFQVCVITLLKLWMPYANIVGLVMKFSAKLHDQTAYVFLDFYEPV